LSKISDKTIADTRIDTAYEKYRRYLCQFSKSIVDTIGSDTNTAILTTSDINNPDYYYVLLG